MSIRRVKNAEKQEFFKKIFRLIIQSLFGKDGFFDCPFKLLISCSSDKITLSLSFDANLAKLGPVLGKLYYTYKILYGY